MDFYQGLLCLDNESCSNSGINKLVAPMKKEPNPGIAALRKVAPQAVKAMGYNKGGLACGASNPPGQKRTPKIKK